MSQTKSNKIVLKNIRKFSVRLTFLTIESEHNPFRIGVCHAILTFTTQVNIYQNIIIIIKESRFWVLTQKNEPISITLTIKL